MRKWLLGGSAIIVLGYLGGIGYYSDKFLPRTSVGGVSVSGKTLEEVEASLLTEAKSKKITLKEDGKVLGEVAIDKLEPTYTFGNELEAAYNHQNPNVWLFEVIKSHNYKVPLSIKVDSKAATTEVAPLLDTSSRTATKNARIAYSEERGYFGEAEVYGDEVDIQALGEAVVKAAASGDKEVEVSDYYVKPMIKIEDLQERLTDILDVVNQTYTLTLPGGETETISKDQIQDWLAFDASNKMTLNDEKVDAYIQTLNEKYMAYERPVTITSTLRGEVEVPAGTYGWAINRKESIANLKKSILERTGKTELVYDGLDVDWRQDRIEVDLVNQKMFVYRDGEQVLAVDIVSGMAGSHVPTPTVPGAYEVLGKESPSVLRGVNQQLGRDYEQPVQYWIPFDHTGQGIHDANWQPHFGGDAYISSGSQGCINTPPGVMPQVYDYAYVGMPVFVY